MKALFEIVRVCRGGGYSYCATNPPHPKQNAVGLYPLHRVQMENKLGRLLTADEVVHHRDGDKENDAVENLEVLSSAQHAALHAVPRKKDHVNLVCACGRPFQLPPHVVRLRQSRNISGRVFCSLACGATKFPAAVGVGQSPSSATSSPAVGIPAGGVEQHDVGQRGGGVACAAPATASA